MAEIFVPEDFKIPKSLVTDQYRLEILEPNVAEIDYDAVMSSKERLSYINRCSPDFFENVCTALLYFENYDSITKTSQSNDGGIDFFAKKTIGNDINNAGVTEITILGQAKRYGKTQVGIGCIRDFLGASFAWYQR